MKSVIQSLLLCGILFAAPSFARNEKLTQYVNTRNGVTGEGHVFLGPSLPFGIVKIGPDCGDKNTNSGYYADQDIHGFSHTHLSGTGGGPKYGNILIMPGTGTVHPDEHSSPRKDEIAKVGYYATTLTNSGIKAELTSTHHCGFHRYTFPKADDAYILVDLGSFLGKTIPYAGENQELVGSEVEILNNQEVRGYSRVRGGWNGGEAYTVYFYAIFDTPANTSGTWKDNVVAENVAAQFDEGLPTGAYMKFQTKKNQTVNVKVGISFISTGKAKANLMKEIPHWDFDRTYAEADAIWENLLSKVKVEGGSDTEKRIFYSSLYRVFQQPIDKTGENPKWASNVPYYDDFFAIWDTFRATHPFISLINENKQIEIVQSLIDIYKNDGYMPDARSGNFNGRTQGGSNCDVIIADAFAKKLKGIDYEAGLASMLKNAEVAPGGNERKEGRGGIADYNTIGYVSTDFERSGSRTVEYAYCDWCIAEVAKGLGKDTLIEKYTKRSENWQNLWRPIEDNGFTGFIMPRNADGTWWDGNAMQWNPVLFKSELKPFTVHSAGSWSDVFYESKSWEYSFYVPHDVNKLIEKCGGKETFIARLDTFFEKGFFQMWNEPGFLAPCLYNYAGAQAKTAKLTRDLLATQYKNTDDGVPGNDDSGSMAAWYCFHALGFFPNAGQDLYLISSPVFKKATISMDNGKTFTISSNSNDKNIYIKSVKLNGKPLNRSWFKHTEIMNGGELVFEMTDKPVHWDTGELPPSESK
ncbi:MAG: GH92 family glycosyl hydrolase [Bacteroidales bacterium]|nr:GH92 family glycosyl hydrolase [Bacteroidales bacterium]